MAAIKLMIAGLEGTTVTLTFARAGGRHGSVGLPGSVAGAVGMYDVTLTRSVAPLDDAHMAVYADVSEAVSCLEMHDRLSLDLLRQRHASSNAAVTHRAFNDLIAFLAKRSSQSHRAIISGRADTGRGRGAVAPPSARDTFTQTAISGMPPENNAATSMGADAQVGAPPAPLTLPAAAQGEQQQQQQVQEQKKRERTQASVAAPFVMVTLQLDEDGKIVGSRARSRIFKSKLVEDIARVREKGPAPPLKEPLNTTEKRPTSTHAALRYAKMRAQSCKGMLLVVVVVVPLLLLLLLRE